MANTQPKTLPAEASDSELVRRVADGETALFETLMRRHNRTLFRTARAILREAPGIMVVDKREPGGYVTPVECVGDYATFVSRIRDDQTIDNGLSFWVVSDNLRKGAALNTVQIAETIINRNLLDRAA